ncbi:MAG: helix-turn-helix transcriptional regulator [Moorellaceae bacterium]
MKWEELKDQLMKDPAFRKEYEELEPEYQLVRSIIQQRIAKGMTQAELAKRVGTRQSAIARLESGRYNPSLRFLKRVAKALDARLEVRLKTR